MNTFNITAFNGKLQQNKANNVSSLESSQLSQSEQRRDDNKNGASEIHHPGVNDVLQGRGSAANNHIGNIRFRDMVKKYQERYRCACKSDKPLVALEIVLVWKRQSPPGRFLAASNSKGGDQPGKNDTWYEISEQVATRKVAQRLREKNSSFNLSQLRRRQKQAMKESMFTVDSQSQCSAGSSDEMSQDEVRDSLSELANFLSGPSNSDMNNSDNTFNSATNNSDNTFGFASSNPADFSKLDDDFFGAEHEERDLETNGFIAMSIPAAAALLDVFE